MTEPPKGGWWTFVRNRLKAGLQYGRWVGGGVEEVCASGNRTWGVRTTSRWGGVPNERMVSFQTSCGATGLLYFGAILRADAVAARAEALGCFGRGRETPLPWGLDSRGLLWQGGDEEFGAFGGVAVFGAEAEEFAGGGGGALLFEGGEGVVEGLALEG